MARGGAQAIRTAAGPARPVGPPLALIGAGFASVLLSLLAVGRTGIGVHVAGYVGGAVVPIVLVGVVRRTDLDRRRSPGYVARRFVPPALLVLLLLSLLAAGLHVWPIATELAT